ncbi:unnamed protein product [Lampetra planeri]
MMACAQIPAGLLVKTGHPLRSHCSEALEPRATPDRLYEYRIATWDPRGVSETPQTPRGPRLRAPRGAHLNKTASPRETEIDTRRESALGSEG